MSWLDNRAMPNNSSCGIVLIIFVQFYMGHASDIVRSKKYLLIDASAAYHFVAMEAVM